MVTIEIQNRLLSLNVQGWDRLWSLKSHMEIPLENVRDAYVDPSIRLGWWKGIRLPGTHIPGVIIAGTFYQHGQWFFWDVKDTQKTIVIDLINERYHQLIVDVENPLSIVQQIQSAIQKSIKG